MNPLFASLGTLGSLARSSQRPSPAAAADDPLEQIDQLFGRPRRSRGPRPEPLAAPRPQAPRPTRPTPAATTRPTTPAVTAPVAPTRRDPFEEISARIAALRQEVDGPAAPAAPSATRAPLPQPRPRSIRRPGSGRLRDQTFPIRPPPHRYSKGRRSRMSEMAKKRSSARGTTSRPGRTTSTRTRTRPARPTTTAPRSRRGRRRTRAGTGHHSSSAPGIRTKSSAGSIRARVTACMARRGTTAPA